MNECEYNQLSREDIAKLVSVSSPRDQAIISLIALSGMPHEEFKNLTLGKFISAASAAIEKELNDISDLLKFETEIKKEILVLKTLRIKTGREYLLFIPPETTHNILTYIKERYSDADIKNQNTDNEDTLFVNDNGKQTSSRDILISLQESAKNAKIKGHEHRIIRPHSLRKYFINTIFRETGSEEHVNYYTGHLTNKEDEQHEIDFKQEYLKLLPSLSLNNEITGG
jgi:integrase